jgi:very-short-patch-repair endonuclease
MPVKATRDSMRASRRLRRRLSPPEIKLWQILKGSPAGIRFRRQYAVGPYVADFYCPAAKLVIEVDGLVHDFFGPASRDDRRDEYIRGLGLKIIRIPASEIFADATSVADALIAMCADASGPSTTQLR